ncbi:O-antigen ligase family protein [Flavobacterium sp.]|uniref:O-antigen ligase family protein n=1 Tax=Flavobacterium sp. TaxID=239 RepID=UPI003BCA5796
MQNKHYLALLFSHILLGILIFFVPFLAKIYGFAILGIGIFIVMMTKNKNNEVLYVCSYIVGSEVFLRMTDGSPNHEFGKYSIIVFMLLGIMYSGFSKFATPYWIFFVLLIPSIFIATDAIAYDLDFRNKIAFNISGPVCLGIASIYAIGKKITVSEVGDLLLLIGLPIISMAVFVSLYTIDIKSALIGTGSNSDLSGGFGPNQVATILGLGMFVFLVRGLLFSNSKLILLLNLLIAFYFSYRGFLTFSRGGMMTGFAMIGIFIFLIYFHSRHSGKIKLNYLIIIMSVLFFLTWSYTSFLTDGLIYKRYAGQNAKGIEKKDIFSGRAELAGDEIEMFLDNPFFGIGVGKGTEIRTQKNGYLTASHDEITRMLAEHGSLGIVALLILLFTPILFYFGNKQNIFMFCFFMFWLLTINHAAMRTASPCFIYALALLNIRFDEK